MSKKREEGQQRKEEREERPVSPWMVLRCEGGSLPVVSTAELTGSLQSLVTILLPKCPQAWSEGAVTVDAPQLRSSSKPQQQERSL